MSQLFIISLNSHLFVEWGITNFPQFNEGVEERMGWRWWVNYLLNPSIPFAVKVGIPGILLAYKTTGSHSFIEWEIRKLVFSAWEISSILWIFTLKSFLIPGALSPGPLKTLTKPLVSSWGTVYSGQQSRIRLALLQCSLLFCLITSCSNYTQERHLLCKSETICVIYLWPQDPML